MYNWRLLSPLLLLFLQPTAIAAPPAWWTSGIPPIITGTEINNRGPANIGQAKWMVAEALRALDTAAPGIAIQIRADLAGTAPDFTTRILDLTVPNPKPAAWVEAQKAPLLLGQLKAIALPFYNRLNVLDPNWVKTQIEQIQPSTIATLGTHYWQVSGNPAYHSGGFYPWNPATPAVQNKALATIGQLKAVFSLRFEADSATSPNGLADLSELFYFGRTGVDPNADADGDGLTNAEELAAGSHPQDSRPPIALFKRRDNPDGTVTYSWMSFAHQGEWFQIETQRPDGSLKTIYATTYGSAKLPFIFGKRFYTLTLNPATDFIP